MITSKAKLHGMGGGGGTNMSSYSNSTLSGINFNLNQLNDESDFTLCTPTSGGGGPAGGSSSQDLMMMMMMNNAVAAGLDSSSHHHHHQMMHHQQNNKRKHSVSHHHMSAAAAAATNVSSSHNDEDSSSSWQSTLYQGRKSSLTNASSVNKRTSFSTNKVTIKWIFWIYFIEMLFS